MAQLFFNSPLCAITGSGSFALSGLFDWQSGSFAGSGSIVANGGLHLNTPTPGTLSLAGETLVNTGAATLSPGATLLLSGGAVLTNSASATFDCAADGTIQNGPGANQVVNAGLFRKINSTGTTSIQVPFGNSGAVQVQTGTLNLAGGGDSSGSFEIASGAALALSAGTHTLEAGATISGAGDFQILGGTVNLLGTVNTLGLHNFTAGTVTLGGNYNPGNNAVTIGACTVNFNGGNPVTAASLTVGGYGSLGGSGIINVSGPMVWNNSFSITGSGSLVANGGLTIASGGSLLGRTLLNTASAAWSNSSVGGLILGGGALITNAPGATFDSMGDNTIGFTTGGGMVANAGLFRTLGQPATMMVEVPFNNSGAVEVQSGTLNLSGGGTNTGTINVFANATLALSAGSPTQSFTQGPGASITGSGQLLVTTSLATANLGGTINLDGSNTFNGGVANLTGNYVCSNVALTIGPATVNFNSSNVISPASLTVGGYGSLGGTNLVTVSGPMVWNNSFTLTGGGSLVANGGLTMASGGSLIGRALVNMASGVWSNSGPGSLVLGGGATFSNAPGATFDSVGGNTIGFTTGGGTVANAGLFQTMGASATTLIEVPFTNTGVVEVQSGTLGFADGGASFSPSNSIAEIAVFSNATVDFHGGTFILDPSAIIDGPGNLSVSGGTGDLAGQVDLSGNHTFRGGVANLTGLYNCVSNSLSIIGGTANFNGAGVVAPASLVLSNGGTLGGSNLVTVSGPMTWGGGGASVITGANSLIVNGGLTIVSGGSLIGRALVNTGPAVWTNNGPGSLALSGGALLSNAPGGTFVCTGIGTVGFSSGSGSIDNEGLFQITGAGTLTTIEVPMVNNGTVEVDAGALDLSFASYAQGAGSTFLNGGNLSNSTTPLQILGGVLTGSGVISGAVTNGALLHPGSPFGQTSIGGSYTQTAAGTLDILLGGPNSGVGFNTLMVAGAARLAGTLAAGVTNNFQPAIGSKFQIVSCTNYSGVFSALNVPAGISVNYGSTGVFLVVTGAVVLPATLQSLRIFGGNFSFNFPTASNQSYTIQQNTNLSQTNWLLVTNFVGSGSTFQFTVPVSDDPLSVFRVRQP